MHDEKKIKLFKYLGLSLIFGCALLVNILGLCGILKDIERNPLLKVEHEQREPVIRELYTWYYEEGIVEDEEGQLWYFDAAQHEGQMWRFWINDMGTPLDVTDDIIVDYVGG